MRMKIHRSLHQAARPGHRRQPGHPDRRAAVDPLAERAPVPAQRHRGDPVTTAYVGANADLVRGFITTPLERVIASADGIDYLESSSAPGRQHDHRAPEAQLRHQRRPHPDPGQGGAGAQRPAARGGGADHRAGDGGQPVRGHVPRLLLGRPRPEPDHRLPDARRAAAALRRSAACSAPTSWATAPSPCASGSSPTRWPRSASRPPSVRDALARNNYLSALGRTKGSMVSVNLVANTDLQHRRGVPPAGGEGEGRRRGAPGRDRRRRARRRELRRGRALQRPDRHLHGHLGAAHRQLARRDPPGARGHARHPGPAPGGHEGRASPTTRPRTSRTRSTRC